MSGRASERVCFMWCSVEISDLIATRSRSLPFDIYHRPHIFHQPLLLVNFIQINNINEHIQASSSE